MKISPLPRRFNRGFTLIELLVVIAILASLAGVSYSIFMGGQDKSRRAQCMANLKELGNFGQQYASDHYGILPCSGMQDDENTDLFDEGLGWWNALAPYALTAQEQYPKSINVPPALPGAFRCPADRNVATYDTNDYVEATPETVSYTSWTDNSQNPKDPSSCIQISRGQLLAGVPWLSDGTPLETRSIRTAADFEEYVLPIAERHGNFICVLYADGSIKQIEEPTFEQIFTSPDKQR